MDSLKHQIHSAFKSTAEMVLPVRQSSAFREKGVLTPAEFVLAGDTLVQSCPTWSWEGGDASCSKPFLPPDKQYLVTRNVPCFRRASAMHVGSEETVLGEDVGGDWVATHASASDLASGVDATADLPTICGDGVEQESPFTGHDADGIALSKGSHLENSEHIPDIDDVPDIDDLAIEDEEDDEVCFPGELLHVICPLISLEHGCILALQMLPGLLVGGTLESEGGETNIIRTRTYDLSITYDKYYQTPRFWLVGYDESKHPMPPSKILEDVSEEHAKKTITVDPHPNWLTVQAASIHPCKHAEVMKKLVSELGKTGRDVPVEQYLVLFVKFIASIIPTIEYDYTMSVGGE
eukprot:CAMPEP_0117652864 /NCGR_PEP_ID=MMETSP0804-20121206/2868_1 /TAXON_ID=1074897 /ORGANISM="Tetraselmis astigmatica, Strain CCMP880" /LENGTH=349 /DNA_ID=CAMNT_0005458967 /DNA_START=158 /DNA_END=1208 /DNA_ORIENTATION=+